MYNEIKTVLKMYVEKEDFTELIINVETMASFSSEDFDIDTLENILKNFATLSLVNITFENNIMIANFKMA